jgi:hypothetical protein
VVLPIADTTTTILNPFFAFFATDFAAFVILSLSARLEPPNFATIILLYLRLGVLVDICEELSFRLVIFDDLATLGWFDLGLVLELIEGEVNAITENAVTHFMITH